jgi:taurine dioxygenase
VNDANEGRGTVKHSKIAQEGLSIRPLGGALAAEVCGIDLAADVDEATMAALKEAYLTYCLLVFPDQGHLTPETHSKFASRWGDLHYMPEGSPYVEGHPEVLVLDFEGRKPPTDKWHSDVSMDECPPMGSLLLGRVIPVGGDTIFANQYLAYEALSDGMKAMLDGMKAVHTGDTFAKDGGFDADKLPRSTHPVVRTHPETGRKALYVNSVYTRNFEGMAVEESQPLLQWLCTHCVQPNFTYRHHWTVGDLIFWDNRCLQHFGVHDYGLARRVMHRVTVLGDKPR